LTGVIDIIHRNVKDTEVLNDIATEIKVLMGGPVSQPMALTSYREEMGVEDAQVVDEPVIEPEYENPSTAGFKKNKFAKQDIPNIIPPVAGFELKLEINKEE
jgi:hypothetical protein